MAEIFSDTEMDFGYFAAHDYDQNKKLDGLELLKAFGHEDQHDTDVSKNHSVFSEELENQVDDIFDEHDSDNDGFLSYKEFLSVQRFHTDVDSTEKIAEKPG
ncbi:multiple coagulation factor deficiency protein 2 homolog [Uloborus diversus]|uniref:multiple coagulation factor deficiency protein 2 homolog n=1 Tax=Uloborus diversus TaxID=327109 RepID=UPI00240901E1|nr:multiple coagulation factor deficiency protein 2 homolog [Uloborus diversus]